MATLFSFLVAATCLKVLQVQADDFLSAWMGELSPIIGNLTLLDLNLPGSHDSMTHDLSTTVSDGGDNPPLDWVLHEFYNLAPGPFIRNQSKTQGLGMREQLDNGIRFIDFRIMYTAPPNGSATAEHDWFCLHFMETNQLAIEYLQELRQFLDDRPSEVVAIWLSRHGNAGNTGTDQYPNVPVQVKQAFWLKIKALFAGLVFDASQHATNTTTINQLVTSNQRLVIYASDWKEFTDSDSLALDTRVNLDNRLGAGDVGGGTRVTNLQKILSGASAVRSEDKAKNALYLQSMSAGFPDSQIAYAAGLHFSPVFDEAIAKACAKDHNIPGMVDWCPATLQDEAQLTNFYNQILLDAAVQDSTLSLPGAIYIDAVDTDGCIRTGTAVFDGKRDYEATKFAYVDTLLLVTVLRTCQSHAVDPQACASLQTTLETRRAAHPLLRWDDPNQGRSTTWPI